MKSTLDQLREMTVVVADTGDLSTVKRYRPVDCTTNPSIVLSALKDPAQANLVEAELSKARKADMTLPEIAGTLTVAVGAELARLVPGRVSTEVEARLSFDRDASIARANEIVADYARRGVGPDRILIKLAATWEGISAAAILQSEGINCNLTLVFSMAQAEACAAANVFLISPFVGRITDWYKKKEGHSNYPVEKDPGVQSVRQIYDAYKSNGVRTMVMGASFRTTEQVKALSGCDNLTIAPSLLDKLDTDLAPLPRMLFPDQARGSLLRRLSEAEFRWEMNSEEMASEKLAEGIRNFDRDGKALESLVLTMWN